MSFYAPWCIWCQRLHPTWEQFAEKAEEEKMPIGVGQVDCVENSKLCQEQKIAAFPTIRWFQEAKGVLPDYKSDRTVNAFNSFANRKLEATERYKDWQTKSEKSGKVSLLASYNCAPRPLLTNNMVCSPRTHCRN